MGEWNERIARWLNSTRAHPRGGRGGTPHARKRVARLSLEEAAREDAEATSGARAAFGRVGRRAPRETGKGSLDAPRARVLRRARSQTRPARRERAGASADRVGSANRYAGSATDDVAAVGLSPWRERPREPRGVRGGEHRERASQMLVEGSSTTSRSSRRCRGASVFAPRASEGRFENRAKSYADRPRSRSHRVKGDVWRQRRDTGRDRPTSFAGRGGATRIWRKRGSLPKPISVRVLPADFCSCLRKCVRSWTRYRRGRSRSPRPTLPSACPASPRALAFPFVSPLPPPRDARVCMNRIELAEDSWSRRDASALFQA